MRLSTVVMFILSLVAIVVGNLTTREIEKRTAEAIKFAKQMVETLKMHNSVLSGDILSVNNLVGDYSKINAKAIELMQEDTKDKSVLSEDVIRASSLSIQRLLKLGDWYKNMPGHVEVLNNAIEAFQEHSNTVDEIIKGIEGGT
eukprot:GHVS01005499.1.p2 GENE.GHVS01005499.1~~GHVS01005499.1.p2  ORF type:complete len:144 (+),score=15.47 GHVS01005499.1:1653-2084(+)